MDVEPDVALLAVLFLLLFVIVLAALVGLTSAGFTARQTQRPYWSVVRSGLRGFMISVTTFFLASVIFIAVLVGGFLVFIRIFIR
jgi:uncharacterized membrane protein